MIAASSYKSISAYGVIGDLRSVALVGVDGSIDWCCLPHMDRQSVFAALVDSERGGSFRVSVRDLESTEQRYVGETNVLETRSKAQGGVLSVTDFMPLFGDIYTCGASKAPSEIHRFLQCETGEVEVEIEWSPRFDYARSEMRIFRKDDGWVATDGSRSMSLCGIPEGGVIDTESGPTLFGVVRMRAEEARAVVTRWGSQDTKLEVDQSAKALEDTLATWNEWAHREGAVSKRDWAKDWSPLVTRSALVFKLLSHADTGAIAAAPTTSLPETLGGVRNWDYRYTWIRDGSLTAQALISIGHAAEAVDLLYWIERVAEESFEQKLELQIMYGLHGERELPESELSHLSGYRGSRPVRIGNEAYAQFQLETYGEVMNTAYELARRGKHLHPRLWRFLRRVADHVYDVWREPDYGIWEVRGEPRHFTYSKVMAWVALDRAARISEHYGYEGDVARWQSARDEVRRQILAHGFDEKMNSFVLSYDRRDLDAANLRIPMLEFLPFDDPRVRGTIDKSMQDLLENGLVYRYRFDDGLPGKEGAFGLCTFWLIDCLAMSGRLEEARELFENMIARANHVGLFAEQIDPSTGEFLGNFPQAFTHIGLINSALYLAYAEGRAIPEHAPIGTPTHRKKYEAPPETFA